jgi:hypothetical protein
MLKNLKSHENAECHGEKIGNFYVCLKVANIGDIPRAREFLTSDYQRSGTHALGSERR